MVRPCILNIKPYKPGKPIEELKRELNLKSVIKLASNENPLGPSPKAVSAIKNGLPDVNRYPDGECFYLKRALAKKYKLKPENIIVGNGSDELIVLTLRSFINKQDEVIIAQPTFLIYKLAALLSEAKVITVPLKAYRYDLSAMLEKVSPRTKLIFIANPDNPTGSYVTKEEVENFLRYLTKNVIVYFDEAYFEYVQAKDYPDTIKYLSRGNVITSRSFSKAYGLSGLRVGWAASSKEIISCLNQVREPFNVNRLAQIGALAGLFDDKHLKKTCRVNSKGMEYLCQQFNELNLFYVPSVANFVLVNVGSYSQLIYQKLLHQGIIVREMTDWGLRNFIRVTIGQEKENKLFMKALKEVFFSLKKGV